MKTKTAASTLRLTTTFLAGLLVAGLSIADSASTLPIPLSSSPFGTTGGIKALPNLMFILDDSGSMGWDYMPDWAEGKPVYLSKNPAFNGVAYDPSVRYQPPLFYKLAVQGDKTVAVIDTTTYPSMNGTSAATGGDASASLPNWRAVKVDGYGIQSTATANLEAEAFSYKTTFGEYCTDARLRTCQASVTANATYPVEARLRWCNTAADAVSAAGGKCQASNIADTATNRAAQVTTYTFARLPSSYEVTVTISAGSISNLTVAGQRILSQSVEDGTSKGLAKKLADAINDCTVNITGACMVKGFRASVDVLTERAVTIVSPQNDLAAGTRPVFTPEDAASPANAVFTRNAVPGNTVLVPIARDIASYPKYPARVDCQGSHCTYAEEMTNYANWYAYYHTRMQMMKTATSHAFDSKKIDEKFRVGYYSINNGAAEASPQFLNVSAFDDSQRVAWYQKLVAAKPKGETPLRTRLADIGRYYAGKLNSSQLNTVSVVDPMQYSCQQNFTILSTDGYWNDNTNPVQLDGTTEIGQQDGFLLRPYYDGGISTKTTTQMMRTEAQNGLSTWRNWGKTSQLQKKTERLLETKTTVVTQPWRATTWQLQTEVVPLQKKVYALQKQVYPLLETTSPLTQETYYLVQTPHTLQSATTLIDQTEYDLIQKDYKLTKMVQNRSTKQVKNIKRVADMYEYQYYPRARETPLVQNIYKLTAQEKLLYEVTRRLKSTTAPLMSREYKVLQKEKSLYQQKYMIDQKEAPLRQSVYQFTQTTTPLIKKTFYLQKKETFAQQFTTYMRKTEWKLQCRHASTTGPFSGDIPGESRETVAWSLWQDVSEGGTCDTTHASYKDYKDQYRYEPVIENKKLDQPGEACIEVAEESGPVKTRLLTRKCVYPSQVDDTVSVARDSTCTAQPKDNIHAYVTCDYTGTVNTDEKAEACTAVSPSGNSYPSPKVECSQGVVQTYEHPASCEKVDTSAGLKRVSCEWEEYGDFKKSSSTPLNECTAQAQESASTRTGDKIECQYVRTNGGGKGEVVTSCTHNNYNTAVASIDSNGIANAAVNKTKAFTACTYDAFQTTATQVTKCMPQSMTPASETMYTGPARTCNTSTTKGTRTEWKDADHSNAKCQSTSYNATTGEQETKCEYDTNWGSEKDAPGGTCTNVPESTLQGPARTCYHQTDTQAANAVAAPDNKCTPAAGVSGDGNTYSTKRVCSYATSTPSGSNLDACTPHDDTGQLAYSGAKVTCAYEDTGVETEKGTCIVALDPNARKFGTDCKYGPERESKGGDSCTVQSDKSTGIAGVTANGTNTAAANGATFTGPARTCTYETTASEPKNAEVTSCTPHAQDADTNGATLKAEVTCAYDPTKSTVQTPPTASCAPKNLSGCTTSSETCAGPKVECVYLPPTDGSGKDMDFVADALTVKNDGCKPTAGGLGTKPTKNLSGTTAWIGCGYRTTSITTYQNHPADCSATPGGVIGDSTNGYKGPITTCFPAQEPDPSIVGTEATVPACTTTDTGIVSSCDYDPEITGDTNASSCTEVKKPTGSQPSIDAFPLQLVRCVRNTKSTDTTITNDTGVCTPAPGGGDPPATGAANGAMYTTKTTCQFGNAKLNQPDNTAKTSCTRLNNTLSATGTLNTAVTGRKVTCEYKTLVEADWKDATGNCAEGTKGADTDTTLNSYISCRYKDGTKTEKDTAGNPLAICTAVPKSTQSPYTVLKATSCAFAGTPVKKPVDSWSSPLPAGAVASCKPSGSATDFSQPRVTCTESTPGPSDAKVVTSCTPRQANTAIDGTKTGPKITCGYSNTTGTGTDMNVTSGGCTPNIEAGDSVYTKGAKVTCGYSATPNPQGAADKNLTSCTANLEEGPIFERGAKVECSQMETVPFKDTDKACTPTAVPQIPSPQVKGVQTYQSGVRCQYVELPVSFDETCTSKPRTESTVPGVSWTTVRATDCKTQQGGYVASSKTEEKTVDSCSTKPSRTGDINAIPPKTQTDITTKCEYDPNATPQNATTCSRAGSETNDAEGGVIKTTRVTCSIASGGDYQAMQACNATGGTGLVNADGNAQGFDANGQSIDCKMEEPVGNIGGTRSSPVPDGCVIPGTGDSDERYEAATGVYTRCKKMIADTQPIPPTSPCVPAEPGVANNFVRVSCDGTPKVTQNSTDCVPAEANEMNLWTKTECVGSTGMGGESNTLADVAAYYYATDLRDASLGNCTGAVVSGSTTPANVCRNDVPTTPQDDNSRQHMTTFTLGLGASGYMQYSESYLADANKVPPVGDYAAILGTGKRTGADGIPADPAKGICSWQQSGLCNWPKPKSNEQTTIDDLWHAGVNGHGAYFSATSPQSLADGIGGALVAVKAASSAAAAPTVSTPRLVPGDSYTFRSTYVSSDWSGELARYQFNPYTADVFSQPDWLASTQLNKKQASDRKIWAKGKGTNGMVAFNAMNFGNNAYFSLEYLKGNQRTTYPDAGLRQIQCPVGDESCLDEAGKTAAAGDNLIDYLRGDRSLEGEVKDKSKYYRKRGATVLGDMVNAQVAYVSKPNRKYTDPGYAAFVAKMTATTTSRPAMVYAAANDGMVHAFRVEGTAETEAKVQDAMIKYSQFYLTKNNDTQAAYRAADALAKTAISADTSLGEELWAYIPSQALPYLHKLADKYYAGEHRFFVDGTPVSADICTANCTNEDTAVWKTILVGGLGRGGRSYYALDVTDPTAPQLMWEFTHDHLGYTYGDPRIVKKKDGTWVVLVTSGYNNIPYAPDGYTTGDGVGRLFVIDAATGTLLDTLATSAGSPTDPSGLAQISVDISAATDMTASAVYGGDLQGNLWRFDINGDIGQTASMENGGIVLTPAIVPHKVQLLAILKDANSLPQPITTSPELAQIRTANSLGVFVGTGRLLDESDADRTQVQSFYAIKDEKKLVTAPYTAIYNNPRNLYIPKTSDELFVNQKQKAKSCTREADAEAIQRGLCQVGSLAMTVDTTDEVAKPVDWTKNAGWWFDLIVEKAQANTNPALYSGVLSFNVNVPSFEACVVGGSSYVHFVNYLTGGPVGSASGFTGIFLANSMASDVYMMKTRNGDVIAYTGLNGGEDSADSLNSSPEMRGRLPYAKQRFPPPPSGIARRISWRELILE